MNPQPGATITFTSSGTQYTVANYKVEAVDPQLNSLASSTTVPTPGVGQNLGTSSFYYLASADVTIPAFAACCISPMRTDCSG